MLLVHRRGRGVARRRFRGSYAEYVRVPQEHAIRIRSRFDSIRLAALPESYATAWTFLRHNLDVRAGQTLLVRGGSSALGQAAINLARLGLDHIVEAHRLMESGEARGKIVIDVAGEGASA